MRKQKNLRLCSPPCRVVPLIEAVGRSSMEDLPDGEITLAFERENLGAALVELACPLIISGPSVYGELPCEGDKRSDQCPYQSHSRSHGAMMRGVLWFYNAGSARLPVLRPIACSVLRIRLPATYAANDVPGVLRPDLAGAADCHRSGDESGRLWTLSFFLRKCQKVGV